MLKTLILSFHLFAISAAVFSQTLSKNAGQNVSGFFNVREYGAKGDSITVDTEAINKAIDAAASSGGGTVFFPAGNYLSFSIHLKSNITLHLDNGAVLIGADPAQGKDGYDAPEPKV